MKTHRFFRPIFDAAFAGFCLSNACQAADALETLLPVTVYASRPALTQLINNPQVLDEEAVSVAHERSIYDVLQGLPGITQTKTAFGQLASTQMRGVGGQGLITLDDIPLLQPQPGVHNLDTLPSEAINAAIIERGPSAAYHPFQALGGAIRLTTQDSEVSGAKLSMEGGSFGIVRETLQSGLAGKTGRVTLTLSRADAFDGNHLATAATNPEREPFRYTQGILRFSTDLTSRVNWQGSMLYNKTRLNSDMLGLDQNYRVTYVDDHNSYGDGETWLAQNSLNLKVTPQWNSHIQLGYTQVKGVGITPVLSTNVDYRIFLANLRNEHTLIDDSQQQRRWQFHWGGQARKEQGESQPANYNDARKMFAGFLDTEMQYRNLSGEIGFRIEHFDRFGTQALYKAAAAWQINPQWTLRFASGSGYRLPSYTDLLSLYLGNLNLKPERSLSNNLSLEWQPLNKLLINLQGYYNRYDDLILQAYDPQRGPTSLNVNDAEVIGAELDSQYSWTDHLQTGVGYTFSDNRDLHTNRQLPFRPAHTARIWGKQQFTSLPVSLWAEAIVRSESWNDSANTLPVAQNVQVNAAIRYTVSKQIELHLRGENLTDNQSPTYYGTSTPGIAVYGGFQLHL